jgi:hypothetical protein
VLLYQILQKTPWSACPSELSASPFHLPISEVNNQNAISLTPSNQQMTEKKKKLSRWEKPVSKSSTGKGFDP